MIELNQKIDVSFRKPTILGLEIHFRQKKYISRRIYLLLSKHFAEQCINISMYVNNFLKIQLMKSRFYVFEIITLNQRKYHSPFLYSSNTKKYLLNKNFN